MDFVLVARLVTGSFFVKAYLRGQNLQCIKYYKRVLHLLFS